MPRTSGLAAATKSCRQAMKGFIDDHRAEQVAMLAALVEAPTDNPPGDCAAHAELA